MVEHFETKKKSNVFRGGRRQAKGKEQDGLTFLNVCMGNCSTYKYQEMEWNSLSFKHPCFPILQAGIWSVDCVMPNIKKNSSYKTFVCGSLVTDKDGEDWKSPHVSTLLFPSICLLLSAYTMRKTFFYSAPLSHRNCKFRLEFRVFLPVGLLFLDFWLENWNYPTIYLESKTCQLLFILQIERR